MRICDRVTWECTNGGNFSSIVFQKGGWIALLFQCHVTLTRVERHFVIWNVFLGGIHYVMVGMLSSSYRLGGQSYRLLYGLSLNILVFLPVYKPLNMNSILTFSVLFLYSYFLFVWSFASVGLLVICFLHYYRKFENLSLYAKNCFVSWC